MRVRNSFVLLLMFVLVGLTACQKSETTEKQKINIKSETCEIIESSEAICEKPVKSGIYTEYSQWEKAIDGTDIEVILEKKDIYDEDFFEDNALIYLVDCFSGNAQCEYEGYDIEEVDGNTIITVQVSGSTELLLNKLHAYYVFFTINKSEAEKIDEAEMSVFER